MKRILTGFLALLLFLGIFPVMGKSVAAAPACAVYFDETPCAVIPVKYLYVVRTNDKLDSDQAVLDKDSGHRHYAWDLNMKYATKAQKDWNVYAPFDLKVVSKGATHSVIVESLTPVRMANGQVDYVTCIVTHMDDISKIKEGAEYKKGTPFYQMGTYGSTEKGVKEHVGAFDRHLHIEVAVGRVCSSKKSFSENMKLVRANGIQINEVFFLEPETPIKKDYTTYGKNNNKLYLSWKTRKEVTFHSDTADLVRDYVVNETFGSLPTPVESGKQFDGWYTADGKKVTEETLVTKSGQKDLYARWKDVSIPEISGVVSKAKATATDVKIALKPVSASFIENAKCGYYLGTNPNFLTKSPRLKSVDSQEPVVFQVSKDGFVLRPSTTYYYQPYATLNGREVRGKVVAFTTAAGATQSKPAQVHAVWRNQKASGTTVSATVSYGKSVKPEKHGLYLGTDKNMLTKTALYQNLGTSTKSTPISYDLAKKGVDLLPNTIYYYQFYVVISGREYMSGIRAFKTGNTTPKQPTQTTPVQTEPPQDTKPQDPKPQETKPQEVKPAKLEPAWSNYNASGITQTDAVISAKITYGKTVKLDKAGFYIGTAKDKLTKADKFDTSNAKWNYTEMSFGLNKYGVSLKPGTTYYYQFYVVVDGQEYKSDVKSFATEKAPALNPVWSNYKATGVTKTNATISAKITYGKTVKLDKAGFYIGTAKDKLTKADKFDTSNAKWNYTEMSFGLNKYGVTLKAGTTYYCQFYVVVDGQEYKSDVKSFTTKK